MNFFTGKCDTVIEQMMAHIGLTIPNYVRSLDPIFYHATNLHELELHTTTRSPIEKIPTVPENVKNYDCVQNEPAENTSTPSNEVVTDNTKFMCSSTRDISSNISDKTSRDKPDHARANDLINSNLLLAKTEIKEEIAADTNSDKENDVSIASDVEQNCHIKNEHEADIDCQSDVSGQSNLSVINEKLELIVPEVVLASENQIALNIESTVESIDAVIATNIITQESASVSNVDMYEGMHFLFGRNPWSDLSLFDALTHQPLLFNHSVFSWPGLNGYSSLIPYYENQNRLINSYFDLSNVFQNEPANDERSGQSACSPSSSTATSHNNEKKSDKIDCSFCHEYYDSKGCLFYSTFPSNTPFASKSACLCCGGEDEEEEQEEEEDSSTDKIPTKVPNINPGWFGKGYRKKIKKRR